MRWDWLRFDTKTLLATVVAGLLPASLLIAISLVYLNQMSAPLQDLFREPYRRSLSDRCEALSSEVNQRAQSLDKSLRAAILESNTALLQNPHLELVSSLSWYPDGAMAEDPRLFSLSGQDYAESVLQNLGEGGSRALLELSGLAVTVQDPMGMSYALESQMLLGEAWTGSAAEVVREVGTLDPAAFEAFLQKNDNQLWNIAGLPCPLNVRRGPAPAPGATCRGELVLWSLVLRGGSVLVAELPARVFLERCFEAVSAQLTSEAGVHFTLSERAGANAEPTPLNAEAETGEVVARQSLLSPFADRWQLIVRTDEAEPLALVTLRRLKVVHYLGGMVAVLIIGVLASVVLAGVVSRQVRLSQVQEDFVRLVSHELRTPVASIRMLAETLGLNRVRSEEERQEFLALLQSESERLTDLVDRVLDFGRAGHSLAREVVTEPGELVNEAVQRFREQHPQGSEVKIRCAQEFHPILLDRNAVMGVVLNLLENAEKYSPSDAALEVTVGEESQQFFIAVTDRGPGISRRDQKRIFRPFERGSTQRPGFGLGLAYCREVAHAHKGRIRLRSVEGEGSTFTLEVPIKPQEGGRG